MKKKLIIAAFCIASVLSAENIKFADNNFQKGTHLWRVIYGKIKHVEENGVKAMELTSGKRGSKNVGKFFSLTNKEIQYYPERMLRVRAEIKGNCKVQFGLLLYKYGKRGGAPISLPGKIVELNGNFQKFEEYYSVPGPQRTVYPYIEIIGEGRALVKSFSMYTYRKPETNVKSMSELQIISDAAQVQSVEFKITGTRKNWFITEEDGKTATVFPVQQKNGKILYKPQRLKEGMNRITASADGAHSSVFVDLSKEFKTDDALARKIKFTKPVNILFLGGSHCEFYKGQNFISRVDFWTNKYNPGKVNIYNYGVGGDHVLRVLDRINCVLTGKHPAWRQEMYKGIFDQQYDYIFTFLGQNDTVTRRISKHGKFARPQIMPKDQEAAYRKLFKILLEKSPKAKIVIMSPSPSYVKAFEGYDKRYKPGVQIYMFGKKEFLDAYDAVSRKLVKEYGLGHIDTLNVMRAYPELKTLFGEDAVHLTSRGGMVVAREVIRWFANQK